MFFNKLFLLSPDIIIIIIIITKRMMMMKMKKRRKKIYIIIMIIIIIIILSIKKIINIIHKLYQINLLPVKHLMYQDHLLIKS